MNENEKKSRDAKSLCYLGKAYVKIPRAILQRMMSDDKTERMIGRLHGILFALCSYEAGIVYVDTTPVFCEKGEYITTYEYLAKQLETSVRSLRRYVTVLLDESLIEVRRVAKRSCFRVCGYELFVATDTPFTKLASKQKSVQEIQVQEEQQITQGRKPRLDLLMQNYG